MAQSYVGIQDSGSNYKYFEEPRRPRLSKSLFDLSYINTGTAEVGLLVPIYLQETVPGDEFTISCEALLRCVNPPVVPLLSRLRVFFHYYWSSCESLWKGFPMFITKGRSGSYVLQAPSVVPSASYSADVFSPVSLPHYLGLSTAYTSDLGEVTDESGFSAMPFMMYMRVYRDYYMNQTLVNAAAEDGQDLSWFPLDDEEFRLPVTAGSDNFIDIAAAMSSSSEGFPAFLTDDDSSYRLANWRWRNWANDYFTTARPWPQRGDEASVGFSSFDAVLSDVNLDVVNTETAEVDQPVGFHMDSYSGWHNHLSGDFSLSAPYSPLYSYIEATSSYAANNWGQGVRLFPQVPSENVNSQPLYAFLQPSRVAAFLAVDSSGTASISGSNLRITLSALRELNAAQRIMEKMALVDGSYGDFCMTFFGVRDPNARTFKPYYVGGTYQKIDIAEVINTADTLSFEGDTGRVQGSQSGHASTYGKGFIGKFRSPSYGYLMGIMSIVPDTMYFQGLNRQFTRRSQESWFIPERAGLSPQAILNSEIYHVPGNSAANQDLFGYQDRFDEMRYRPNEIHGKVADSSNESFFPYTQAREFDELPALSPEFVSMGTPVIGDPNGSSNVRSDWLTSSIEVPFIYQVANKVRAVRPLTYRAQPAELFDTRG